MKRINVAVSTGIACVILGALGADAQSAPADQPVMPARSCSTSKNCGNGQYCYPPVGLCYWGVSATGCNEAACNATAPGATCHFGRCHVGAVGCSNSTTCGLGEYCHFGVCHAETCKSDADCPVGVPCFTPNGVCALP